MKKIVSIVLVAIMAVSLAFSAAAASGVNSKEAVLLVKFNSVVDQFSHFNPGLANQYKNVAENTLAKVDLDDAACDDLSAAIDKVVGYAKANGIDTPAEARRALPTILAMVNEVAGKYGIQVSVDAKTGYVTVTINGAAAAEGVAASSSAGKITKQTGIDMTATYIVIIALFATLACGLVVVSKKNLLVKD